MEPLFDGFSCLHVISELSSLYILRSFHALDSDSESRSES